MPSSSRGSRPPTTQPDIPTLTASRLRLRPFTETDAQPMHRIFHGKDVLRYFPPGDVPTLDGVQTAVSRWLDHWKQHGLGLWAVEETESGQFIGRCGFQYLQDTDETEIDFILAPAAWGRGYATEAARAALHYGFSELELDEIIAIVHPDNAASRAVITKIGMGNEVRATYFDMDCYRYSLSRSIYLEGRSD